MALDDETALTELARSLDIQFIPQHGEVNIILQMRMSVRTQRQEVAEAASQIVKSVLGTALLQLQRDFANEEGLIADGRDMGTVVFPHA